MHQLGLPGVITTEDEECLNLLANLYGTTAYEVQKEELKMNEEEIKK